MPASSALAKPLPPLAALAELARTQSNVFTLDQARLCLVGEKVIARLVRSREWIPQRRGVYINRAELDLCAGKSVQLHAIAVQAYLLVHSGDLVVSHASAAALHHLSLLKGYGSQPVVTLHRPEQTPPSRPGDQLAASVPTDQRSTAYGMTVTTRERTVADLARTSPWEAAVVMADAALRAGVDRDRVLRLLNGPCTRWPGAVQARRVLQFADRRSESALESRGRCWFDVLALPAPEPQVEIYDEQGRFVARVDFLFKEQRTICETDGRGKYLQETDDAKPDRKGDALWVEKVREDRLRALRFEVVRAYWSDGDDEGARLNAELMKAFAAGVANPFPLLGSTRSTW